MTTLTLLASIAFPAGPIGLLFKLAVICVIAWVIWALGTWAIAKSGKPVPYPLTVIFWGIVALIVIYLLFQLVMAVL